MEQEELGKENSCYLHGGEGFVSLVDFLGWLSITSTLECEAQPMEKWRMENLSMVSLIVS